MCTCVQQSQLRDAREFEFPSGKAVCVATASNLPTHPTYRCSPPAKTSTLHKIVVFMPCRVCHTLERGSESKAIVSLALNKQHLDCGSDLYLEFYQCLCDDLVLLRYLNAAAVAMHPHYPGGRPPPAHGMVRNSLFFYHCWLSKLCPACLATEYPARSAACRRFGRSRPRSLPYQAC